MKCPKCMEKRILDDVPVKNLCPKCGSEMHDCTLGKPHLHCDNCSHRMDYPIGHEEKVGEKPPVVDTEEDDPWGERHG